MAQAQWTAVYSTRERVEREAPDILHALARGEYLALVVEGFYEKKNRREVVKRLTMREGTVTSFNYPKFDGTILRVKNVGPFLMQYLGDRAGYFQEARRADTLFAEAFAGLPDARQEVRVLAGQLLLGKRTAIADEDGVSYSSAVVRIHGDGEGAPIHRDRALADAQGWTVSQFHTQLSAVLSLQKPESGGELVIYRRGWTPADDALKKQGTLGYPEQLVAGADACIVEAQEGDLYIFNAGFFHEIRASYGPRLRVTLGTFFAFSPDDPRVIFWS